MEIGTTSTSADKKEGFYLMEMNWEDLDITSFEWQT